MVRKFRHTGVFRVGDRRFHSSAYMKEQVMCEDLICWIMLIFLIIFSATVRPVKLKEDILSCTFAELSFGLCQFIQEVRRPNGEKYDPDSILYLCLGIQQVS